MKPQYNRMIHFPMLTPFAIPSLAESVCWTYSSTYTSTPWNRSTHCHVAHLYGCHWNGCRLRLHGTGPHATWVGVHRWCSCPVVYWGFFCNETSWIIDVWKTHLVLSSSGEASHKSRLCTKAVSQVYTLFTATYIGTTQFPTIMELQHETPRLVAWKLNLDSYPRTALSYLAWQKSWDRNINYLPDN